MRCLGYWFFDIWWKIGMESEMGTPGIRNSGDTWDTHGDTDDGRFRIFQVWFFYRIIFHNVPRENSPHFPCRDFLSYYVLPRENSVLYFFNIEYSRMFLCYPVPDTTGPAFCDVTGYQYDIPVIQQTRQSGVYSLNLAYSRAAARQFTDVFCTHNINQHIRSWEP